TRAPRGPHRRRRVLPRRPAQLRLAVPRPVEHGGVLGQGHGRDEPRPADRGRCEAQRRPVGVAIPETTDVPARDPRGHAVARRCRRRDLRVRGHGGTPQDRDPADGPSPQRAGGLMSKADDSRDAAAEQAAPKSVPDTAPDAGRTPSAAVAPAARPGGNGIATGSTAPAGATAPVTTAPTTVPSSPPGTMAPGRRTMPGDHTIAVDPGYGVDAPNVVHGERRQSLNGFEDTYTDIVDYIVRITHRIWEDQDVGYIYDTYAPGCRLYDDSGVHFGVEQLIAGTMQSINAFPDCRHYADDVIWAGSDEEGFVTSHRAINIGHHTGPWRWSGPTGRKLETWVIANCGVRNNEIYEEWVLYNTAAKLQQLGIDVLAAAREYGNSKDFPGLGERGFSETDRIQG